MNPRGLITKAYDWFSHADYTDSNPIDWIAGVVVCLILAFLWSRVLKLIEQAA